MMTAGMKVGYKTPPAVFNGKFSELYDTIDELEEELDEAKREVEHWKSIAEQSQWVSVDEKLPPVHIDVLVWCGKNEYQCDQYHIARIDKHGSWYVQDLKEDCKPICWKPLEVDE